ncbi:expressed unknown protein [Seminavis robusta]|uniref:Uncharacterized protein n=1 Tax=Seminavis robusta TaxID=568900 RepID=A0A9N8HWM0_9STRA|nr:expressed unknown protein [Seminavis robusta]|eukprot:Sro2214_g319330.1 n/a (252) ;mRNA; r:4945-5700
MRRPLPLLVIPALCHFFSLSHGWNQHTQPVKKPSNPATRRDWIKVIVATACIIPVPVLPEAASADTTTSTSATRDSVIAPIRLATKALQALLDNWEESVVDCNYADVPRELLETKNKEELLEKASTFALFDKSVAVVTCKTSNKKIRDYLGRTGIGPLVGLDKKLRLALDLIDDPDDLDPFVQASETIQQALSRADSYSYTAGGDYSALNNFEKEESTKILQANGNLQQVRQSIGIAVENLSVVLTMLDKT